MRRGIFCRLQPYSPWRIAVEKDWQYPNPPEVEDPIWVVRKDGSVSIQYVRSVLDETETSWIVEFMMAHDLDPEYIDEHWIYDPPFWGDQ